MFGQFLACCCLVGASAFVAKWNGNGFDGYAITQNPIPYEA